MEISVLNKIDTNNLNRIFDPKIEIAATNEEIEILRKAADICDQLRITFIKLEIFDKKAPETAYESLLEIADILEDHCIGEKE
jgi:hypothetical protein